MADVVSVQALAALETAVSALLPPDVPAGLTSRVRVLAQAVRPLGMGGYIGRHFAPDASLHGRRVAARIDVDVSGGNDSTAQGYVSSLAGQVLAQTRADFARRGVHRIRHVPGADQRALAFDVDFEFVLVPDAGEGLITDLALETFANVTPYRTRMLADFSAASLAALPEPLADFVPADDPQAAPPGVWAVSAAAPVAIVQTAATAAGGLELADPQKAGASLLWRPRGQAFALPRFVASIAFQSADPDGIGLVFARRGADDYHFFLASQRHGYHLFGRRRPAGWQTLASAPAGFDTTRVQRLVIGVHDTTLFAQLGDQRTLSATTAEPLPGGEIGLLTHGNDAARFLAGRLMELT
jgi:hypothetical protein